PPVSTAAERAYENRLDRFTPPGVVDNQYVTWVFEYGVFGAVLCAGFLALLLSPLRQPLGNDARHLAAALVGTFVAIACLGVTAWEEAPTDLLAALVLVHFLARKRAHGNPGAGSRGRTRPIESAT
ncbi:MAG: hypothetical protein ABR521_05570, partial [Gaiellaceae bacterium]